MSHHFRVSFVTDFHILWWRFASRRLQYLVRLKILASSRSAQKKRERGMMDCLGLLIQGDNPGLGNGRVDCLSLL